MSVNNWPLGGIFETGINSLVEVSQCPSNPADISIKTGAEIFWMPNCQKHLINFDWDKHKCFYTIKKCPRFSLEQLCRSFYDSGVYQKVMQRFIYTKFSKPSSSVGILPNPINLHFYDFFMNECPVLPFYSL
nr:hypothetical protein [Nostoc sp. DedVER01b]